MTNRSTAIFRHHLLRVEEVPIDRKSRQHWASDAINYRAIRVVGDHLLVIGADLGSRNRQHGRKERTVGKRDRREVDGAAVRAKLVIRSEHQNAGWNHGEAFTVGLGKLAQIVLRNNSALDKRRRGWDAGRPRPRGCRKARFHRIGFPALDQLFLLRVEPSERLGSVAVEVTGIVLRNSRHVQKG